MSQMTEATSLLLASRLMSDLLCFQRALPSRRFNHFPNGIAQSALCVSADLCSIQSVGFGMPCRCSLLGLCPYTWHTPVTCLCLGIKPAKAHALALPVLQASCACLSCLEVACMLCIFHPLKCLSWCADHWHDRCRRGTAWCWWHGTFLHRGKAEEVWCNLQTGY